MATHTLEADFRTPSGASSVRLATAVLLAVFPVVLAGAASAADRHAAGGAHAAPATPAATPAPTPAAAPTEERLVINPPKIRMLEGTAPKTTLLALPPPGPRTTTEKQLDLNVVYTESAIFNPATGRKERVRLRSYTGGDEPERRPYVAPTIDIAPGDTVRITLNNRLPADPSCFERTGGPNIPHCFNGTNLHTHGLWVSPAGNSDNVLLSINPGVSFQYEYNIPPDHPAGTFWYHSHRHGSTALQVSSGMAGALIIRGDRLPTADGNGDIDTLLKRRDGNPLTERVLVLQQIQYACLDAEGRIKVQRNEAGQVIAWVCDEGDVGGIEGYGPPPGDPQAPSQFGPGTWGQSGRYTSINGLVLPNFRARAGDIERWRLIHAGVRETISLQFRRLKPDAAPPASFVPGDVARWISENCTGEPLPYHVFAQDGLTLAAVRRTMRTTLQPGYRADALVVFPEPGKYCVVNAQIPAAANVSRAEPSRGLLGVVVVEPGRAVDDVNAYVRGQLIQAARRAMPQAVRARVVADLEDGLKLTRFVAHRDVADDEITGTQELTFLIDLQAQPPVFGIGAAGIPPRPYDPQRIDRTLMLGGAEEWTLRSGFAGHPFHMHVNPFQIVRILDPQGRDVSAPDAVDDAGGAPDPQYPGLKGVWKDTLWVKSLTPPAPAGSGTYTVVVRSRTERYLGDAVLHCHILDHEDQGMMENIRFALPDGSGGVTSGHH